MPTGNFLTDTIYYAMGNYIEKQALFGKAGN